MTTVVLASASPRRHDLLTRIGVRFVVRFPDVDESPIAGEKPVAYVARLAFAKALAVASSADELIIAADTTVDCDGVIMGKPRDRNDAESMLRTLSGRAHLVHTGVTVRLGNQGHTEVCTTSVTFVPLERATIDWYLATEEPLDKAGSYALQGAGAALVASVDGSVSSVVGLPVHVVIGLAARLGVDLLSSP
ncbi:MAG: Maf family protein, partial [Ilumatobacteraceae bacterium]